jgi:hypothetical protein
MRRWVDEYMGIWVDEYMGIWVDEYMGNEQMGKWIDG